MGLPVGSAAKLSQASTVGTGRAAVVLAHFADEPLRATVPSWSEDIFDINRPGSFSHFYATMSFNQLVIDGEIVPGWYRSEESASAYRADSSTERGRFDLFSEEIIRQVDQDVDFGAFDNDGPDGIPNSGDDDGVVDALFIVLPSMPRNFILGGATGVATLGWEEAYTTDDPGANGLIQIAPRQGTLQLGRDYHEAVSVICHEYGHVLGLPDLFNTAFLRSEEPGGPENDSAGIGNWGLMGWGTLGWNRTDGPNSFSAWSRMRLGWTPVLEAAQANSEIRLRPIGQGGPVFKATMGREEFFLLEHRLRAGNYYDRNMPAEGLLVWHVRERFGLTIDLECADGLWRGAGFPQGQTADPTSGGDNLDFWAHDTAYAERHGGNLGDATDPFDGVRFNAFTPETNPASFNMDGTASIRLEDIRYEGTEAVARFQTAPPRLLIEELSILGENNDEIIEAGETIRVNFRLVNAGGLDLEDVRVVLVTDDSFIEVIRNGVFGELAAWSSVSSLSLGERPLALRYTDESATGRMVSVALLAFAGDQLLGSESFSLTKLPIYRLSGLVIDNTGQPAPGVQIHAQRLPFSSRALEDTVTNALGRYEFILPEGRYNIFFTGDTAEQIDLSRDTTLDFTLPEVYQLSGVLKSDNDYPLDSTIYFHPLHAETSVFTAQSMHGDYGLFLPPGRFHVAAGKFNDGIVVAKQDLGILEIANSGEAHFTVRNGEFLKGRLVDDQGDPVSDAQVHGISPKLALRRHSTSDEKGSLLLTATSEVFEMEAIVAGQNWPLGFQDLGEQPLELALPPAAAALRGRLFDAADAPLVGGEVMLLDGPIDLVGKQFFPKAQTDQDGAFALRWEPGRYLLVVGRFMDRGERNWLGRSLSDFELQVDMQEDFRLDESVPMHRLEGAIVYEAGEPKTDALLAFYDVTAGTVARTLSGFEDGAYAMDLPQGHYQVWARLHSVVGGIAKLYDLGPLEVSSNMRWDAHLTAKATAIAEGADLLPQYLQLAQNYPNPFNAQTVIRFELPQAQTIKLRIYNLAGQEVTALAEGHHQAGRYTVKWDGKDRRGRKVATGVYLYRLQTKEQAETRKFLLLR